MMPYRIKIEPKRPLADEAHLLDNMDRMGLLLRHYRGPIVAGLLVLIAGAVLVGVVLWWDARQSERAMALDREATMLYLDRPVDQPTKADENLKQAIALYRQLLEHYPHSRSALLALYHLGNGLVQANDLDGAIDAYQKFVAAYGNNRTLLPLVQQRLGYAYLLKGEVERGRSTFNAVLNMPHALNKDQVMFELGKLEETQSRPEAAMAHYQELMKTYPSSPFAGEAAVRSKALEAKQTSGAELKNPSSRPPGSELKEGDERATQ
jgi:tetratricopeptide (TPR) repeat protein